MRERLDGGCIVILSNLGYSSSGEVLNCKYVFITPNFSPSLALSFFFNLVEPNCLINELIVAFHGRELKKFCGFDLGSFM